MKRVAIPDIITANTYFWRPGAAAAQRRSNERRRQHEACAFFAELGLKIKHEGDNVFGFDDNVWLHFYYSESAKHVYKKFRVEINGRRSNLKGLKSYFKKLGIELY